MEQLSFTQFAISLFRQHKDMPKVWEIALGEQGMRFNLESGCLEPIMPIFKKDDKITKDGTIVTILDVLSGGYLCDNGIIIPVYLQDKWKLYTFNLEAGKYYVCTRDWDKSSGLWHKGGVYLCQNDHFLVADNGNLYPWYSDIHLQYLRPATEEETLREKAKSPCEDCVAASNGCALTCSRYKAYSERMKQQEDTLDNLTEFEEAVKLLSGGIADNSYYKKKAEKLLILANKQHEAELEQAYKNADEVQYQRGYKQGYKDAENKISEALCKALHIDYIKGE